MIILIGSHGTGKTTLLEELEKITNQFVISDGYGRPVREAGDKLGLSQYQRQVIINTLTKHRWNKEIRQKNYVCTRSIIDEWVYCKAFGHDDLLEERKQIFRDSNFGANKYFYIPVEFPLEEDGIRYSGAALQKQCDDLMVEWIKEFNLEVVELRGSVEERLQTLLKHIV